MNAAEGDFPADVSHAYGLEFFFFFERWVIFSAIEGVFSGVGVRILCLATGRKKTT